MNGLQQACNRAWAKTYVALRESKWDDAQRHLDDLNYYFRNEVRRPLPFVEVPTNLRDQIWDKIKLVNYNAQMNVAYFPDE